MNFLAIFKGTTQIEGRSQGPKPSETAATDDGAKFDSVLSTVESEGKPGALATKPSSSPAPEGSTPTAGTGPDPTGTLQIPRAILDLLGDQDTPASLRPGKDGATAREGKTGDSEVDGLLKRVKAKHDSSDREASADSNTTPAAPSPQGTSFVQSPPALTIAFSGEVASPTAGADVTVGCLRSDVEEAPRVAGQLTTPGVLDPLPPAIKSIFLHDVSVTTYVAPTAPSGALASVKTRDTSNNPKANTGIDPNKTAQSSVSAQPEALVVGDASLTVRQEPSCGQGNDEVPDQAVAHQAKDTVSVSPVTELGEPILPQTEVSPVMGRAPRAQDDRVEAADQTANRPGKDAVSLSPATELGKPILSQAEAAQDLGPTALSAKQLEAPIAMPSSQIAPHAPIRDIAVAVVNLANQSPRTADTSEASKTGQVLMARTVTLQMSPADLGTVEIRLHLTGHALDLHLKVSEQDTLGLVTHQRDELAAALHDHNYELRSLVIQDGSSSAPSGGPHVANHEPSSDARPERHNDGERPGAQGDGGRGSQHADRQARNGFRPRDQQAGNARAADGRSLFV